MYCQNCGSEILDDDQYCQGCGTPVGNGGETAGAAAGQGGGDPTAGTASHGTGGGQRGGAQGTGQQQYGQQPNAGGRQGGRGGGPQQGPANQGGHQHGGHGAAESGTLQVHTEADKYLKRFATFNLAMAILSAFIGLLFVALGSALQSAAPVPPVFEALLGVFYIIMFAIAALYAAVWYFAKRRSAVAVYGGTALYGIATLLNAISLNVIGFPITLLGLYWGYKSFDAV